MKYSLLNAARKVNVVRNKSKKLYAIQDASLGMIIMLNTAWVASALSSVQCWIGVLVTVPRVRGR